VSGIPWWSLPLVAGVFAVVGGFAVQLVTLGNRRGRRAAERRRQWYDERRSAYVGLLAAFDRAAARLRREYDAGVTEPDPLRYHDEVGAPLTTVRLLASGPVRNAALAVHRLLEDLHGPRPLRGHPDRFVEVLGHVPLVLHDLEVAIRDELDIHPEPPPVPEPALPWRDRFRALLPAAANGRSGRRPPSG
jgi:hypothetical protein